jgi:cysteine desulfurase
MHYFDYNATTPLHPAAKEAWLKATERHWHNPSSLYREAGFAAQQLDAARERLADILGCDAGRILFTSGATEANNALISQGTREDFMLASSIEHPSVFMTARELKTDVPQIPVDEHGVVRLSALVKSLRVAPGLVSIMAANNESGSLQPWPEIAKMCKAAGIRYHTDASQWIGKLPVDGLADCDYITGSAHKFGGPKGVGFLVLSCEDEKLSWLKGGPQEAGRRAGTENYPGIEAMVTALEHCSVGDAAGRDQFEQLMLASFPGLRVIGQGGPRLWNTSLLVMPEHSNLKWLTRLTRRGFAISTGSACSSGKEGSSVVMQALGAQDAELRRVVRLSSGWDTTLEDWQALAAAFVEVGAELAS